jgi:hypothetical protein
MSQLGLGVTINMLSGYNGHNADEYYGYTIAEARFESDAVIL